MKAVIISTVLLFSTLIQADNSQIQFEDGWIKHLPPVVPMRAGYLTIENKGKTMNRIVAVQSPAFEWVEMHETIMADGIMKMVQQDSIDLYPEKKVLLKPGGKHLMMMKPKQSMAIGDTIEVIMTFADGSTRQVQLEVKQ